MKFASKKSGRDGELLLVSRDLTQALSVTHIVPTLQALLDNWSQHVQALEQLYASLNLREHTSAFNFQPSMCDSPLPRAYHWADASAYVNHVELVRRARGAEIPESFWREPLMYQGGSDDFIGPCDDITGLSETDGIDFEAEVAVVTDDVPMGVSKNDAHSYIRLLMLVNDISLRGLIPEELAKGFGFYQSKPANSFSPVAVTVDELGDAWHDNKLHLPLLTTLNDKLFGRPNAGVDMTFNFSELIAHAAKTRNLCAGSIIGSGTISNKSSSAEPDKDWGETIDNGGDGYSCIAERRMIELINNDDKVTPYLKDGDRVVMDMLTTDGESIFGAIDQIIKS